MFIYKLWKLNYPSLTVQPVLLGAKNEFSQSNLLASIGSYLASKPISSPPYFHLEMRYLNSLYFLAERLSRQLTVLCCLAVGLPSSALKKRTKFQAKCQQMFNYCYKCEKVNVCVVLLVWRCALWFF